MSLKEALLERTLVYRLWQAPFVEPKLRPLLERGEIARARRVLDVGCGPGTNTARFGHAEYLGVDVNPRYVEWARRRHGREFVAADIRDYEVPSDRRFDFVLVNSFLHHTADDEARSILAAVASVVAPGGAVHVVDVFMPERPSLARFLARHDRGRHVRPLAAWRELLGSALAIEWIEPYPLARLGVPLWHMFYCKGRPRR